MSPAERDLMASVLRSALFLTMIVTIPITLITGVLGPILGMIAFAAAIPLSGQLGGSVPLGQDLVTEVLRALAWVGAITAVASFLAVRSYRRITA